MPSQPPTPNQQRKQSPVINPLRVDLAIQADAVEEAAELNGPVDGVIQLLKAEVRGPQALDLVNYVATNNAIRAVEREVGVNVPAVALTASSHADDRERALRAGFQVHLPKVLAPSELAQVVAQLTSTAEGVRGDG